jgi:hypothetical protein
VLALACLALFTTLLMESAAPAPPALVLDGASGADRAEAPTARPVSAAPRDAHASRATFDVVFTDEPEPIPSGMLTALERAAEEPLDVELARLLDALQYGFGERSVRVEPTLRPYAFRLAGRLNVRPVPFRVRVAAPDPALAEARAGTLRNLFEAAGVAPGRLAFVARRGAPALLAEPA